MSLNAYEFEENLNISLLHNTRNMLLHCINEAMVEISSNCNALVLQKTEKMSKANIYGVELRRDE